MPSAREVLSPMTTTTLSQISYLLPQAGMWVSKVPFQCWQLNTMTQQKKESIEAPGLYSCSSGLAVQLLPEKGNKLTLYWNLAHVWISIFIRYSVSVLNEFVRILHKLMLINNIHFKSWIQECKFSLFERRLLKMKMI